MCGIAGILYADPNRPIDARVLQSMGDAIAHRGPDASGCFVGPGVGLAHRRLSIIDLVSGNQPIGNEDGSVQVVFNGEIYNFRKLKKDLEARGHTFRTHSDTEVIVHLYEDLGERLVERLRGMFAFAIWDVRRRQLLLARDRLGIKPLYFHRDPHKLLFASELKAILAHPHVDRTIDTASLDEYLTYGMVPGGRSIFQAIEKLPPGCVLSVPTNDWDRAPRRYWELRFEPDHRPTVEEWKEAVTAKLEETVRLHLVADVPVGAFLSGGLDSSMVVSLAADQLTQPLQTFSMGFDDLSFSELPFARCVADRYRTQHTEEIVTPSALELIDDLTQFYDEPFADSSAIPTFLVSRLASQKVKVVLSGDGGDEAFGGYSRYTHDLKEDQFRKRLPPWIRKPLLGPIGRVWPKADWLPRRMRFKTALTNLSLNTDAAYANTLTICRQPLRRGLMNLDLAAKFPPHDATRVIRDGHATAPSGDTLSGMLAADVHTILPDDFLVKVDRASMAHGLEVRPPLLDHEFMELAARIPSKYKVHEGETKWLFKQICRKRLPPELAGRPKKGFEIPIDAWLRGPHRESFENSVLSPQARVRDLINQDRACKLFRTHVSGIGRNGNALWALLMLARWADRYLSGPPTPDDRPASLPMSSNEEITKVPVALP